MAYKIKPYTPPATPKSQPNKKVAYLQFLKSLPCVISGTRPVEAAHLSFAAPQYGHWGRGKQQKAPDHFALPLCPEKHREQHSMNEEEFWKREGINPHVLALSIFAVWANHPDQAEELATDIIRRQL